MESMANGRIKYIDAAKGVNILIVMCSHARGIPIVGALLTSCFMQVFFVLTGYTYRQHDNESVGDFAAGKAKRLLIPYFVYAGCSWMLESTLEGLDLRQVIRGGMAFSMHGIAYTPIMTQ